MSEWYLASLLVTAGACLGLALHASDLAVQRRGPSYGYLAAMAVLGSAYCGLAWVYFRETSPERALPYGQALCAFSPFVTCIFAELTFVLSERCPRWLIVGRKIHFALTASFALGVVADIVMQRELLIRGHQLTDLASAHRHRLLFTPAGAGYLLWTAAFVIVVVLIQLANTRRRRELAPLAIGCAVYFATGLRDLGVVLGLGDGVYISHFGFIALVLGAWRVLGRRLEQLIHEQHVALLRLEQQRQRLLLTAPVMQKQKLDSVGALAAGVAHEINNPVHGILNYAQLLKRANAHGQTRDFAHEIEAEAKRIADVVRQLLHVGRTSEKHAIAANVRDLVRDTVTLLRSAHGEDDIQLEIHVDDDVHDIICHMQQVQQALSNLITNAREALIRRDTSRGEPKAIRIRVGPLPSNGDWVRFEVIDNGDGFDHATAERVFDPFFTTKPVGEGTGLGLSICHGIAGAHGGTMSCESTPGRETRFRLDLPLAPPDIARSAHREVARKISELPPRADSGELGAAKDGREVG